MKMGLLLSEESTEQLLAIAQYEDKDCLAIIEEAIRTMSAVLEAYND